MNAMPKLIAGLSLAASFLAAGCTVAVRGPRHSEHPAYLHALDDLRAARSFLERPAATTERTAWDENVAIREIDAAIGAIKEASIDDGKNLNDHPPVDAHMGWSGRLHRADELLHAAHRDCAQEEDNGYARGLRNRAIQHIDAAIHFTEEGIANNHY